MSSGKDRFHRRGLRAVTAVIASALGVIGTAGCGFVSSGSVVAPTVMTISSEAFGQGVLLERYTCHGEKINPPLDWSGVPQGTKSFALVVDDASAPITPYIYWLVFDISPASTDIQEGALPTGARQALNSAGTASYDAPCPGGHPHSYRFTVYALNTMLNLPEGTSLKTAWTEIASATIGRGRIMVTGNS